MGRRTKTLLPTSSKLLEPKVIKTTIVRSEVQEERRRQKQSYDRHAKELTTLQPGQNVRVNNGDQQWSPLCLQNQDRTISRHQMDKHTAEIDDT